MELVILFLVKSLELAFCLSQVIGVTLTDCHGRPHSLP